MKELVRSEISPSGPGGSCSRRAEADHRGNLSDVVTDADHDAHAIYLKLLRECFPGIAIIAEEEEAEGGEPETYFTVDPLDGTKAFVRRQSHGIGTMISLVDRGQVIAAYVGDVMTQEVFGFRPGSPHVHRISEFDRGERLRSIPNSALPNSTCCSGRDRTGTRRRCNAGRREGLARPLPPDRGGKREHRDLDGAPMEGRGRGRRPIAGPGNAVGHLAPDRHQPEAGLCVPARHRGRQTSAVHSAHLAGTYRRHHAVLIVHETRLGELSEFLEPA